MKTEDKVTAVCREGGMEEVDGKGMELGPGNLYF